MNGDKKAFEITDRFTLSENFLQEFVGKQPKWGFGALSYVTYKDKYARLKADGTQEEFWETLRRVVEGTFSIQKTHCRWLGLEWIGNRAQASAQQMYRRMWEFKFLPPGRGLWAMGTEIIENKGSGCLNNCSFISSKEMILDFARPFTFLMDFSMLGVGVGFDLKGAGKVIIKEPKGEAFFEIPDTREGWVDALRLTLEAYTGKPKYDFDFSKIRARGEPIKGFGGVASGPAPLKEMIEDVRVILDDKIGENLDSVSITDIFNIIGKCVVAGNVRRSAEIAIGEMDDLAFIDMKNPEQHTDKLKKWRWASNNSVFGKVGMNYSSIAKRIIKNGEPGIIWMDNIKSFGRFKDGFDNTDFDAAGVNPCSEQVLESSELCCLVETFPANHENEDDFLSTLKYAYMYAKTVTLVPTHDQKVNAVMLRNRRIGTSQSGIEQAKSKFGYRRYYLGFCDAGYVRIQELDRIYSRWLCVPQSKRTTSVKPSGCRPWFSLTTTSDGILTLEELFDGHDENKKWDTYKDETYVLQDGERNKITRTYNNGLSNLMKITLNYGLVLYSTPNHQWFVNSRYYRTKNKQYMPVEDWVRTDQITPDDILDVKLGIYKNQKESKLKSVNSLSLKMRGDALNIQQPKKMNPDIAWLLGYLWGDGSMSPSKYRLRFTDSNLHNLFKANKILQTEFAVSGLITPKLNNGASTLECASKMLWHWLIKNDVFKYYQDRIDFIPKVVRSSSRESIIAFFAGLIDADGCVPQNKKLVYKVHISTSYYEFARHIQDVSWTVGLGFGFSHNTKGKNLQKKKSMFMLTLGKHVDKKSFEYLRKHSIKVSSRHGKPHHEIDTRGLTLGKVISVEKMSRMVETYDIEVENKHWYYSGAVKSHNTVSLLAGATPGVHYAHSEYYYRTQRFDVDSPIVKALEKAGYRVEPAYNNKNLAVVYFPIKSTDFTKGKSDVTIWEQMENIVQMQHYWADNSISCTVTFQKHEEKDVARVLEVYDDRLKNVSLLPLSTHGYRQAPYITIDEKEYKAATKKLKTIKQISSRVEGKGEKFCTNDSCDL